MEDLIDRITENVWMVEVFVILIMTAIARFIAKILLDRLVVRSNVTQNVIDDSLVEAARRPVVFSIWILGISFAAEAVGGAAQAEIFSHVSKLRDAGIISMLVWFSTRFTRLVEEKMNSSDIAEPSIDKTTLSMMGKLVRAAILITGFLLVMQAFGISVTGVLAMGGVGGLAIGFAARDLLANIFGTIMIFIDKPFKVGDWVRSPDREIEGTVEEINWRATIIRTFDKRPLYVPNSLFANMAVETPSRQTNRRIYETIGLRYDDIETLEPILVEVRDMLSNHKAIDQNLMIMVNFLNFGSSSLDFFLYCFTKTTDWATYHQVKEDVLFKIASIIKGHGAEIAFPTQTLDVKSLSRFE
ncbi:mechanosensitive ion channel family protein [Gammaproteobacteria bacterium]|nr:mechanosensitive ion channel family protein [Gammaproteobacteria bacterium]